MTIPLDITTQISTFGFIGDTNTKYPDLALELADLGLLIPMEELGDRVAVLSQHLAWDQKVTQATGRSSGDTLRVVDYVGVGVFAW